MAVKKKSNNFGLAIFMGILFAWTFFLGAAYAISTEWTFFILLLALAPWIIMTYIGWNP